MAAHGFSLVDSVFLRFIFFLFIYFFFSCFYMRATYGARLFRARSRHWPAGVTWPSTVFAMKSAGLSPSVTTGPENRAPPGNPAGFGPATSTRSRMPPQGGTKLFSPSPARRLATPCGRVGGERVVAPALRRYHYHYHLRPLNTR